MDHSMSCGTVKTIKKYRNKVLFQAQVELEVLKPKLVVEQSLDAQKNSSRSK
jgi:hypothetical protein